MYERKIMADTATSEDIVLQPLSLAVTALQRASPADACLALQEAVESYAQRPSDINARKIEASLVALRHHVRRRPRRTKAVRKRHPARRHPSGSLQPDGLSVPASAAKAGQSVAERRLSIGQELRDE
jgi:hypothetical protein